MPTQILMPALSPTMTEGNLAKWLKKEGDRVKPGDVLAEIETDKATMEVEAVDEGVLGQILVPAGTQAVKVNAPIAVLLGDDEKPGAVKAPPAAPKAAAAAQAASAAAPAPAPALAPKRNGQAAPSAGDGGRLFASPLARRMAEQAGIDLARIAGSGPGGRIVKADIEAAIAGGGTKPAGLPALRPAAPAPVAIAAPPPAAGAQSKSQVQLLAGGIAFKEVPLTSMRKVIARRLTESKQQVPHFYLSVDCQLDALLETRKQLNERAPDSKISVNDFVIKAAALALRKVPAANASWSDECILQWEQVDVSVAVAIPGGLITPIIKRADQKGLATISAEMKDLAQRAKDGKLKPEEFQGGTFSISNLGMFGIKHFEAVINPPQGAILAVGAGEPRPVVRNGALAVATVMTCTLSVDHRVIDGAVGAAFMQAFKKIVEDPLAMML